MQALSQLSYTPTFERQPNYLDMRHLPPIRKKTGLIRFSSMLAEWTGLEPATPGVTGRYSNQLNYHSNLLLKYLAPRPGLEPGTYGLTVRRSTD